MCKWLRKAGAGQQHGKVPLLPERAQSKTGLRDAVFTLRWPWNGQAIAFCMNRNESHSAVLQLFRATNAGSTCHEHRILPGQEKTTAACQVKSPCSVIDRE